VKKITNNEITAVYFGGRQIITNERQGQRLDEFRGQEMIKQCFESS
jgi:hypothetical protein